MKTPDYIKDQQVTTYINNIMDNIVKSIEREKWTPREPEVWNEVRFGCRPRGNLD